MRPMKSAGFIVHGQLKNGNQKYKTQFVKKQQAGIVQNDEFVNIASERDGLTCTRFTRAWDQYTLPPILRSLQ